MSGSFDIKNSEENSRFRSFYNSLGLLIILNVLVKPAWIFLIDRKLQLETGSLEYGNYFALLNLSIVLSFVLDFGFSNFYNRQLAYHKQDFVIQAGSFLLLKLLFILLYAGAMFIIAALLNLGENKLICYLIIIQSLTSLFLFFRSVITASQWFRTDAWLSVLDKTLIILVCGSMLYFPVFFETISIQKFLVLQMSCTGLATVSALLILLRRGIPFKFRTSFLQRDIFLKALPFGIIILLMSAHYRLDGFLLERLKGPGEAGLYASAYRILDAANMVGYLAASFLLPFVARLLGEGKEITTLSLFARHVLMMYSLLVVTALVILSPWVTDWIYHNEIPGAETVLAWSIPALIGYSLVQVYGTLLTASGNIVDFCWISLIALLSNIGLNIILIPANGALGACYAAITSQALYGLACMLYCRHKLSIPISLKSWLIYMIVAAILTGVFMIGDYLAIPVVILLVIGSIVTLASFWFFKPNLFHYWLKLKTSVT